MQYELTPSVTQPVCTVVRRTTPTLAAISQEATRLRSWALIMGERVTGLPFARLLGPETCSVHLPVEGRVTPHPETGIEREDSAGQACMSLRVVRFDELRDVLRELSAEIAVDCGLAGAPEFHPSTAEFTLGTVLWPVYRQPAAQHRVLTVADAHRAALVS